MSNYRFYFLGPDGHIAKAQDIDCLNDMNAFAKAKTLVNGCGIEIWQEARQVAHISPEAAKNAFPFQSPKSKHTA